MAEEPSVGGPAVGSGGRELRASRLTLVDGEGNVRAVLGAGVDGASGLHLYDDEDRLRLQLALDASGATNIKLHDRDGEVCAWLAAGRHGAPSLYLRGASRHRREVRGHAELAVDEHGCPVLSLHDRTGSPRVLLSLDEQTGMATLSYADARGNSIALLAEEANGGRLRLVDRDPRPAGVPTLPLGEAAQGPAPAASRIDPVPAGRVAVLEARLAQLEGRTRRQRRTVVGAAVLAAVVAVGVAEGVRALRGAAVPDAAIAAAPIVRAEQVILTDRSGEERARLGVLPDGTPTLRLTDADGESSAELSVLAGAGALLRLQGDRSSIVLAAPPGAPPSLGLHDGADVVFQAPSGVARFPPPDAWP